VRWHCLSARRLTSGTLASCANSKFSVGLTGGIGSGKSTVADLFAARGASVIDTDIIAHQLTAPGGLAVPRISAHFGPDYLTAQGALDRAKMRARVFAHPQDKRALEEILHPLIRQACEQAAAVAQGPYVLFVVPLLVESGGWKDRVQRVLVVDCPEELQVQRVMVRSALTADAVRAIMAAQAPRHARLAAADDVIVNDSGVDALLPQVQRLHTLYCTLAGT
jgi:dephospho-CoA kinase